MASILFLMRYPLDGWDNLKNKFDGQMAAVEALGHEAWYIGFDKQGMWLCRDKKKELLKTCALTAMPGYTKTFLYVDLMAALEKALAKKRFDLVYMRYMPVFSNAPAAIRKVKKSGAKFIVEHPTYPVENGRTTSLIRKPVFKYNEWVFGKLEPMIDLYTLIGDPCGETLNGIPAMNIVNGVDVERLPMYQPRKAEDVSLLALASMSHWQGYDRLIEALRATFEPAERIRIARRIAHILHEEQPYTFLFAPNSLTALSGRYRNVRVFPVGIPTEIIWTPKAQQLSVPGL